MCPDMRNSTPAGDDGRKPNPEPMDPETFQKLTRCIAELLVLVMDIEPEGSPASSRSNVVQLRRRKHV